MGKEVPELQRLAMKLVPLLIGSGPAERTWQDVGAILTKKRNRLGIQTCLDLVFVRTFLRRSLKVIHEAELECLKEWETTLLLNASYYDGPVEPAGPLDPLQRVFEDSIENWEHMAIDGNKGGEGETRLLTAVRQDKVAKFQLQEKYKGLFMVDKDPGGVTEYYETEGDNQVAPAPVAEWENRKIIGLCWQNRQGWYAETKKCSELAGESTNYQININLIRMIRESTRNRLMLFRSQI